MPLWAMISISCWICSMVAHPLDVVVAAEAAVDAVVLAVVGDVQGGEEVNGVAEVALGLPMGLSGHFLQEGAAAGERRALKSSREQVVCSRAAFTSAAV